MHQRLAGLQRAVGIVVVDVAQDVDQRVLDVVQGGGRDEVVNEIDQLGVVVLLVGLIQADQHDVEVDSPCRAGGLLLLDDVVLAQHDGVALDANLGGRRAVEDDGAVDREPLLRFELQHLSHGFLLAGARRTRIGLRTRPNLPGFDPRIKALRVQPADQATG
ncbi:MAG: hypothetical protein FJX46_12805 [Alphaproteobacteria bacterium]|nr:hypothetical protein [Alphaproteobacteria bacterium]